MPSSPPGAREEALLQLQRAVGNRGFQALLGGTRGGDADPAGGALAPLAVVQRDFVDDARSKLSRGLLKRTVTARDAAKALTLLSQTPVAGRLTAIEGLGQPYLGRMISLLPATSRSGATYTCALVALGRADAATYATFLGTGGDYSWVGAAEAPRLLDVIGGLPLADRSAVFNRLRTANKLGTVVSNAGAQVTVVRQWLGALPRGEALTTAQRQTVDAVFNATPNTLETLTDCVRTRFHIEATASPSSAASGFGAGVAWEEAGLRRAYPVLAALPPAHVAGNAALDLLTRYGNSGAASGYYGGGSEAAISYNPANLGSANTAAEPGDPLFGVNRFDKVVRHEVGHAVDEEMGWSASNAKAASNRGGWKTYSSTTRAARAIVKAAAGPISQLPTDYPAHGVAYLADVVRVVADVMAGRAVPGDIKAHLNTELAWYRHRKSATRNALATDPTWAAVRAALNSPWYNEPNGGPDLAGRVYQEAYAGRWVSYKTSSRARKVSLYQFRAPGEWFAEVYATYYEPDNRGEGAKLNDRDANTKAWFDTNVHTRVSSR